ncbi:MAG TPA: PAS domain S-box protein [Bacteroidales bacterium]|nr:PAS domain S-box protein [Bacteroidales bacterium]
MNNHYKILIVEDNPLDAELARREIRQVLKSVEFVELCTENKFLESLENFKPDIIVSDFSMPNFDGMSVIKLAKKHAPLIPVIIFTGSLNEETAAETVKIGAVDYVLKENNIRLRQAIQYALEKKQMWRERLEAEEKLRLSEERYRVLFELAADGILRVSAEGKIIDINHSGLQLSGYNKTEVLQMHISEFFTKKELEKKPIRYDLLQKGHALKIERTFVRKDGSTCIVEMHSKMMPDNTIQSIFRDITERKNIEMDLRESEEQLSQLIQTLPIGVVIHNKGKVVFANEATFNIMEAQPDISIDGLNIFNFIAPEYHEMASQRIRNSIKGNQTEQVEEQFITLKGNQIAAEVKTLPILFKGEKNLLSVFSDITARKQAELHLKESEAKYRSFFENTGTAIAISEEDTTLSLVNEKYAELVGLPKEEIENKKSFLDFMVPEDIENSMKIHSLRLKEPKKAEKCYELGFKNVRGEVRNMLVYTDIIPGTNKSLASLLDITERKIAEEELRKNRMFLRTMIDSLPIWISAVDTQGNYVIANKYYESFFNKPLELIEGHNFKELFTEQDYQRHNALVDKCLSTGKSIEVSETITGGNNITAHIFGTYTPLFDEKGKIFAMAVLAIDISKQKLAEIALKESETRFRSTFEGAPIGMCLNFTDGKFFEANNAFCQMIGYSIEELRSRNFIDITHPDDIEISKQFISDILQLEGSDSKSIEKRYLKKDGSLIWVITSVSLYRDTNDNPKYFIVQILDITEQKLTEQKLIEAKNQLEVVFNNGPDAILLTHIEDGHYIDSNKTFTRYTGYTPDDLRGKSTLDIDIWGNPDDRNRMIKEVKEKGFCHNFELEIKNKDRTTRVIEMSAEVILIKGKPHLLTISRDIAERKKMEELLKKQNEELHELVSTKDRFFSIIAHDLKDPHNAILGFSEILAGSYDILSDQDRKNYIVNILHSSQNLSRLLRNLLEWANSQTGRMIYKPESINISAVVQETMDILLYQAKIKQIRLIPDISSSHEVFADPNMVRTILRNLVSNAIKYTHRNGFVKISTSSVTDKKHKTDFLEISVIDNGIGIKKENIDKLFKLDHKVKTSGTEEEMGSGLGLILCYELVRKNNGYLNISSEENVGTTVTFALPKK